MSVADGPSSSFEADYRGAAVEGFYEYLTRNEKLFVNHPVTAPYYAKFCSVVQSSGTGKSRLLTELRTKDVIIIYMNLREKQDVSGFPMRDSIPSSLLTNFPPKVDAYQTICYAFLTALFDTLHEFLSSNYATQGTKAAIMEWVNQMCDMRLPIKTTTRRDFFRKLLEKYAKTYAVLVQYPPLRSPDVGGTAYAGVESTADKQEIYPLVHPRLTQVLTDAYMRVGACLASIFPDHGTPYKPKLVIAIDEAHPLCPTVYGYRPADILCSAVSDYTHAENHAVWVAFASTTSKVADFSPPNSKFNSARIAFRGEKLFPPYTQLGWDQNASGLGKISVEDVGKLDHIMGYGRPLWVSLKTPYSQVHQVLRTASLKLYGPGMLNPDNTNHVLAILGQRFGLNVTLGHPDSVQHLEKGVASHLRICLATTFDRNWRFTSYPSEPFLSCVAASDLHAHRSILGSALRTLLKVVNSGMIDMGQRGELASRLLWLLSKDLFIRTKAENVVKKMPQTWEEHLIDCQMIPVVDWLEFIFGPQIWDEEKTQASIAREMFKDAYLNFSHWVCMDANIAGSKDGKELSLNEWTLRHWQRTSGVQCCHQQPLIDKVIPIYFKDRSGTASAELRMSQILISDKAQVSKNSKDVLHDITLRSEYLSGQCRTHDSGSLPYIAILADLGQPASFSATFPGRDVDDRCLRIYAAGVDTVTYPFLTNHPELKQTLQDLVHLQQVPETETPYTEYLNAQMKFGSTATPEHMVWEHGKDVPSVKGGLS